MLCSFGQNSTVRGHDIQKTSLVLCKMTLHPKDTLNPVIKSKFCEGQSKTFFLNGLELPFDSLVKLNLRIKNQLENQSFYELRYKEDDPLYCIEHINYFITIKIPIFVNGEKIPLEKSFEILGSIAPNEIVSIQRLKGKIEIKAKLHE